MTAAKDSPSRSCSATCLTCLTSLDYQHAPRPGTLQDPGEMGYVSHLIEDGVDPTFVQRQVGHSWASTTAGYTSVGADAANRMMRAALAPAFAPGMSGDEDR